MCFPHAGQQLCDLCNVVLVLTFVLTTFGHICPCQILAGAELIYGCVHLLWSQHRRTMSNKPFHGLIWLSILYAHASLIFQHTLLFFLFCFKIWYPPPSSLIYHHCCCCNQHIYTYGALFFMHLVCYCCSSLAIILLLFSIQVTLCHRIV